MDVANRSVLVTGATGGIGQAIVRDLAARGARLVLTGRRAEQLEALASEVGGRAVVADLAQHEQAGHLVEEVGEVDILVSNAGLPASGLIDDFTLEQLDRALDVNLRAPLVLARLLVGPMQRRGTGQLVFVSSLGGKAPTANAALYSATKFGLRGFAHSLREDLHGTGVGVSLILPGPIRDAGMWAEASVALPRFAGTRSPQDVAEAVADAIAHDRAEVIVSSTMLRVGALLAGTAPSLTATLQRRTPASKIMGAAAASQRHKR
jgi:uncharacterized protein